MTPAVSDDVVNMGCDAPLLPLTLNGPAYLGYTGVVNIAEDFYVDITFVSLCACFASNGDCGL